MRRLTTILVMILCSPMAAAQDIVVEETPQIRRYTVEVIIFSYAEEVSVGTELFEPDELPEEYSPLPAEGDLVFEDPQAGTAPTETSTEAEAGPEDPEFILHIEDDFTMTDILSRLERLDAYEPIMHFAWTQATYPQEETLEIELPALGEPPEGLTGSFMLYLSRYLHLVVDLTLDDPASPLDPVAIEELAVTYGDDRVGFGYEDQEMAPIRFRIQENRIFKNGDLRYFDHPKFGVLAKITRVEEIDDVEPEMLGDDPRELLGSSPQ
jgi:hypothetical protein